MKCTDAGVSQMWVRAHHRRGEGQCRRRGRGRTSSRASGLDDVDVAEAARFVPEGATQTGAILSQRSTRVTARGYTIGKTATQSGDRIFG